MSFKNFLFSIFPVSRRKFNETQDIIIDKLMKINESINIFGEKLNYLDSKLNNLEAEQKTAHKDLYDVKGQILWETSQKFGENAEHIEQIRKHITGHSEWLNSVIERTEKKIFEHDEKVNSISASVCELHDELANKSDWNEKLLQDLKSHVTGHSEWIHKELMSRYDWSEKLLQDLKNHVTGHSEWLNSGIDANHKDLCSLREDNSLLKSQNMLFQNCLTSFFLYSTQDKDKFNEIFSISNNENRQIYETLKNLGEFYYIPNCGNAGDSIIATATYQYFNYHGFNYHIIDRTNIPDDLIEKKYNLVYGGGGIFVKEYQEEYKKLFSLFNSQNLQQAVILPHTILGADDLLAIIDSRWTVFCREKRSYDYCSANNTKAHFFLADDMAINLNLEFYKKTIFDKQNLYSFFFSQNGWLEKTNQNLLSYYLRLENSIAEIINNANSDIGIFLRQDIEKKWNLEGKINSLMDLSMKAGGSFFSDKSLTVMISRLFLRAIDCFSYIVTDRLHVGICASLLGKKVYLLDNNYGKISSVYNHSMKNMKNVTFYNNPDELIADLSNLAGGKNKLFSCTNFLIDYGSITNEIHESETGFW